MSDRDELIEGLSEHTCCFNEATARELADAYRAEVLSEGLSVSERLFLTFALELAADQMASRSDEFDADDEAALKTLRRMADGGAS